MTNAAPNPVWTVQVEYRGEWEQMQVDGTTSLTDLAFQRVGDHGTVLAGLGGEAHRLFELELVDPDDPSRGKRLDLSRTVEDAALWDGAKLRLRLADAFDVELIDEDQKSIQQIVPASLTLNRLVEEVTHRTALNYHVQQQDLSLPGGLRRLDPDRPLSEIAEFVKAFQRLSLVPYAEMRSHMAAKSLKVPVVLVDAAGEIHRYALPLDLPAEDLERLARTLPGGQPLTELSVELIPARTESQMRPRPAPGFPDERDVYSGPDKAAYQHLGKIAPPDLKISGRDEAASWWELVYPPDSEGRGWMERQPDDPVDPEDVPAVAAPRVLEADRTLWESGVTQDTVPWIRILPGLNLFERLSQELADDWQPERLTIRATGLLVRFRPRDGGAGEDLYVRAREDDDQLHFQLPLLQLTPLQAQSLDLLERLGANASRVAPLRFVHDDQQWVLLALSIDRSSFFELQERGVDLLRMMSDGASWQTEIRTWIQPDPDGQADGPAPSSTLP